MMLHDITVEVCVSLSLCVCNLRCASRWVCTLKCVSLCVCVCVCVCVCFVCSCVVFWVGLV